MTLRRRDLVVGAGALGATWATGPGWSAASSRSVPESVDALVIGAGFAGLNAAMIVAESGASVRVLEGDTRVGGRARTADGWFSAPELGAAQIGPMYARTRDMARRLGVKLGPGAHVNAPYSFVLQDQLVAARGWAASPLNHTEGAERVVPPQALSGFYVEQRTPFKALDDWLQPAATAYDISLAEWLRRQKASTAAVRLIQNGQGATPLEELALLRMMQEATRSRLDVQSAMASMPDAKAKDVFERFAMTSSHVVGGTSRLTDAMAATLGDRIRLGARAVSIDMRRRGRCEVRCADGSRFLARRVIVAVPFSVLRELEIRPALRGDQADAVARMPYHNQSQVWLEITKPYWEQDGVEASMWTDGPFTLIRQQIENDGSRVLISALSFGPNSRVIDALPEAERGRRALEYIEKVRPSTRGALRVVGVHSWRLMPLIRGCSHQFVPGRAAAWSLAMIKPHEALHFAGEHTRRLEVGMEAAMESGERAALEVLDKLLTGVLR